MPAPHVVQAIVRQRSRVEIDRHEAIRLMRLATAAADIEGSVEVHGREPVSGAATTVVLRWRDLLTAPDGFLPPA